MSGALHLTVWPGSATRMPGSTRVIRKASEAPRHSPKQRYASICFFTFPSYGRRLINFVGFLIKSSPRSAQFRKFNVHRRFLLCYPNTHIFRKRIILKCVFVIPRILYNGLIFIKHFGLEYILCKESAIKSAYSPSISYRIFFLKPIFSKKAHSPNTLYFILMLM